MIPRLLFSCFFFFNDTATTEIYTLSLHDALPILITSPQGGSSLQPSRLSSSGERSGRSICWPKGASCAVIPQRSEEHTSELQSQSNLVCRLLLEKKKKQHPESPLHSSGTYFRVSS